MCEKSWMCMWRWAHRHMSQNDFVYVFLCVWGQCLRGAQTKTDRERRQGPTNDYKPANSWVTSEVERSHMLCSHFCTWADIYSPFPLPPPSSSPQLLLCPSGRTCHCHPAQPGRQHPCLVIPMSLFAQITRGFASTRDLHRPPACSLCICWSCLHSSHAWHFILAVVECIAKCAHTWTYAGIPSF